MQYAIARDIVYVLEANPRASRTVPLVSKICDIPMAKLATKIILGKKLASLNLKQKQIPYFGVKQAVFPFNMFQEVDPLLGPEMRSTGEVLGLADSFGLAFFKAEEATQNPLPSVGTVLITVADVDKEQIIEAAQILNRIGFKIVATDGTCNYLVKNGIPAKKILKIYQGRPNIADAIKNNEIQLIINTPIGKQSQYDDSYIRKEAIKYKISYITTATAAVAAAKGIMARQSNDTVVKSLQRYHADLV
jgi:carbamoyl-phosphate synthase large subunit